MWVMLFLSVTSPQYAEGFEGGGEICTRVTLIYMLTYRWHEVEQELLLWEPIAIRMDREAWRWKNIDYVRKS